LNEISQDVACAWKCLKENLQAVNYWYAGLIGAELPTTPQVAILFWMPPAAPRGVDALPLKMNHSPCPDKGFHGFEAVHVHFLQKPTISARTFRTPQEGPDFGFWLLSGLLPGIRGRKFDRA
jgi:hypothetical protein